MLHSLFPKDCQERAKAYLLKGQVVVQQNHYAMNHKSTNALPSH